MELEQRKKEERDFSDKMNSDILINNKKEFIRLATNRKFYCITRQRQKFFNDWLLAKCKNKRILNYCCGTDYCCGESNLVALLLESAAQIVGIDISKVAIKKSKERAALEGMEKKTLFFVMDAEKMNFPDNCFDIIVCSAALHHLDINRAYPELFRVLKPTGEIICSEPLVYNPVFQLYRKMTPHLRTKWEMKHIIRRKDIYLAEKYFDNIEIKFFFINYPSSCIFSQFLLVLLYS